MSIGVTFTICDAKGAQSSTTVHLPAGTSIADIIGFGQEVAALLDAIVGGQICGIGASIGITLPGGLKGAAVAGTDREEGALFIFRDAANTFKASQRLPTFYEAAVYPGTTEVDVTGPDVAAWVDMMINGVDTTPSGGTGVIVPVDYREGNIGVLVSAEEDFKRFRK